MSPLFDSIPDALAAIRNGECVVVVDDERRENEGDLICAAQFATPEQINFMATEARGLICLAMEGSRLDALDLPLMVDRNTDANQTAFTVSIDAGPEHGVSTGISADDRSRTIQVAIQPGAKPADERALAVLRQQRVARLARRSRGDRIQHREAGGEGVGALRAVGDHVPGLARRVLVCDVEVGGAIGAVGALAPLAARVGLVVAQLSERRGQHGCRRAPAS